MAAWLVETAWRPGLVVVQGGEELLLARAAEARVGKRQRESLVALNRGCELAEMLEIVIADSRARAHQEGTQDYDCVPGLVLLPLVVGSVFEPAVLLEELGAEAGIKLLAKTLKDQPTGIRCGCIDVSVMARQWAMPKGGEGFEFRALVSAGDFESEVDGVVNVVVRLEEA